MIRKMFCKLGLHNWDRDVSLPVVNTNEIICRTYDICKWCDKHRWFKNYEMFELKGRE